MPKSAPLVPRNKKPSATNPGKRVGLEGKKLIVLKKKIKEDKLVRKAKRAQGPDAANGSHDEDTRTEKKSFNRNDRGEKKFDRNSRDRDDRSPRVNKKKRSDDNDGDDNTATKPKRADKKKPFVSAAEEIAAKRHVYKNPFGGGEVVTRPTTNNKHGDDEDDVKSNGKTNGKHVDKSDKKSKKRVQESDGDNDAEDAKPTKKKPQNKRKADDGAEKPKRPKKSDGDAEDKKFKRGDKKQEEKTEKKPAAAEDENKPIALGHNYVVINTDRVVGPEGFGDLVGRVILMDAGAEDAAATMDVSQPDFGRVLLDAVVRHPDGVKITNYKTSLTGLTAAKMAAGTPLKMVQQKVNEILANKRVVGFDPKEHLNKMFLTVIPDKLRDVSKYHAFKAYNGSVRAIAKRAIGYTLPDGHDLLGETKALVGVYEKIRKDWEGFLKSKRNAYHVKRVEKVKNYNKAAKSKSNAARRLPPKPLPKQPQA